MTTRNYINKYLNWVGMSNDQIESVIKSAIGPETEGGSNLIARRIDTDIKSFSSDFKNTVLSEIDRLALDYCNQHCPDVWFKQAFKR